MKLIELKAILEFYRREMKIIDDERELLNKRERLVFERFLERMENIEKWTGELKDENLALSNHIR